MEHFKAAAIAADSKSLDPVLKYLAVGRQLGYAFYMTFDAMAYVDVVGIRKFEGAARLQREAYRAWVAGLLCNVAAGVYTLWKVQAEAKKQGRVRMRRRLLSRRSFRSAYTYPGVANMHQSANLILQGASSDTAPAHF